MASLATSTQNICEPCFSTCGLGSCKSYGCNANLSGMDPASQYQRQKLIWNTVRVPASVYMSDLAALSAYEAPLPGFKVNWNQMSDRRNRSFQPTLVAGGSTYHASSVRNTITRCRPGAGCPGGYGVDVKHNSYDRYLNRLKGQGPVRRGVIPPGYGGPVPARLGVQGGKTVKTNIVAGCDCPVKFVGPFVNPWALISG
jgi:hypothetical protein